MTTKREHVYTIEPIFEQIGVDCEEAMTWALGDNYGNFHISETPEIWNSRHGDIFTMDGDDSILENLVKIGRSYAEHVKRIKL